MAAKTYGTIPKGLLPYLDDPRVDEVSEEGIDGYWIYLRPGWNWEGVHTVHEYTVSKAKAEMERIEKCEPGCDCKWDWRKS